MNNSGVLHYQSNYLTHVIFRVDFPKILRLDRTDPPAQFQDTIMGSFPHLNERKTRSLSIDMQNSSAVAKQEEMPQWEFMNKEKTQKIIIESTSFVQEFLKYTRFPEFFDVLKETLESFFQIYPMSICTRLGLRYINRIKIDVGDPLNWENLLFAPLYETNIKLISDPNTLKRSMHSLELKEGKYNLRFNYGIFNSEYPNPVARKEFILDYDCYYDEEEETSRVFDMVKEFNMIITKWFEKSISDGLRSNMGVTRDG